jgi:methylsterol monooxygenase
VQFKGLINQYKMTRKSAEIPAPALFTKLYQEAFFNHFVTTPLSVLGLYPIAAYCGMPAASAPLPPLPTLALLFAAAHAFNDVFFYATHRLLHSKLLYKRFHKQHHTFRGSVGAAAEFAHPVEVLASNQLPTAGLVLALGAHPLAQAAWLVLRLTQTYEVHSGYAFNGSLVSRLGVAACGAPFHDHHHTVRGHIFIGRSWRSGMGGGSAVAR